MAETKELYTTGKLSEMLGVTAGKIKKAIEELKLEPDDKKGRCAYYGPAKAEQLKKHLG